MTVTSVRISLATLLCVFLLYYLFCYMIYSSLFIHSFLFSRCFILVRVMWILRRSTECWVWGCNSPWTRHQSSVGFPPPPPPGGFSVANSPIAVYTVTWVQDWTKDPVEARWERLLCCYILSILYIIFILS